MSLFASPLISLFFFSGIAVAGLIAASCSSADWEWSFNSLEQNPCMVAAYMQSTCYGGSFTVPALPSGYEYSGPYQTQASDLCMCNTITYSLLSACGGCQGSDWISWLSFSYNCTKTLPPFSFPNPIPAGTSLPRWALLDITSEGTWNNLSAKVAGDSPELGPGAILGPDGVSSSTGPGTISSLAYPSTASSSLAPNAPLPTTATASLPSYTVGSSSNTTSSIPGPVGYSVGGHSSNTGAIAGGTVAGIAAISIVIVALFFYRQRRRSQAQSAPPTGQAGYYPHVNQVPQRPMSGQATATSSFPGTSASLLRTYNPEDRSTFPEYQGTPNPSFTSARSPSLSNTRNLYTVATPPSSGAQGYYG